MWRGWGYVILVIVLAVFFNLNTFFEFTYGTYSEIYCAEASGCEGWEAKQLASSDSHSCIFTRETGSWSSDGHLFIQFTALKMDPIYNSLSIGFNIIEGKGDLPCDKAMDTKKASLNSNYITEDNEDHALTGIVPMIVLPLLSCKTFSTMRWELGFFTTC